LFFNARESPARLIFPADMLLNVVDHQPGEIQMHIPASCARILLSSAGARLLDKRMPILPPKIMHAFAF
jgi:hypothetical protein